MASSRAPRLAANGLVGGPERAAREQPRARLQPGGQGRKKGPIAHVGQPDIGDHHVVVGVGSQVVEGVGRALEGRDLVVGQRPRRRPQHPRLVVDEQHPHRSGGRRARRVGALRDDLEREGGRGARSGRGGQAEGAAHGSSEGVRDEEPEAGRVVGLSGAVEGLLGALEDVVGHALARVADLQQQGVAVSLGPDAGGPVSGAGGLRGVAKQVRERRRQAVGVGLDRREPVGQLDPHARRVSPRRVALADGPRDHAVDPQRAGGERPGVGGEGPHAVYDRGDALHPLLDVAGHLHHRVASGAGDPVFEAHELVDQALGVEAHIGQRVVDLVGHAPRELADGCQPLRVLDLLLERGPVGHVLEHPDDRPHCAQGAALDAPLGLDRAHRAVIADEAEDEVVGLAGLDGVVEHRAHPRLVVGVVGGDGLFDRRITQGGVTPVDLEDLGRPRHPLLGEVEAPRAHQGDVFGHLELLQAGLQGHVAPRLGGDVARDGEEGVGVPPTGRPGEPAPVTARCPPLVPMRVRPAQPPVWVADAAQLGRDQQEASRFLVGQLRRLQRVGHDGAGSGERRDRWLRGGPGRATFRIPI